MTKELVISSSRHETKLAILEDDQLAEVFFQRAEEYSLVGSIHKGRVTRVLPGMQSAFVDLGLERDAFLYVSDFMEEGEDYEKIGRGGEERPRGEDRARGEDRSRRQEPRAMAAPAAPVAPAPERTDESDASRDRRGRRSRRRRNRGRGFPESKYAAPGDTLPVAPAETGTGAETEAAGDGELEAFILPGESLAKYKRLEDSEPTRDAAAGQEIPDEEAVARYLRSGFEARETGPESRPGADAAASSEAAGLSEEDEEAPSRHPDLRDEQEPAGTRLESSRSMAIPLEEEEEEEDGIRAAASPRSGRSDEEEEEGDEEEAGEGGRAGREQDREQEEDSEIPLTVADLAEARAEALLEAEAAEEEEEEEQEAREAEEAEEETVESAELEAEDSSDAAESGSALAEEALEEVAEAELREQPMPRYISRGPRRLRRRRGPEPRGQREFRDSREPREQEPETAPVRTEQRTVSRPEKTTPSISDLLKEGQEIIVQIAKEPLGQKGARITSHVALPGRYVVYMPTLDHLGVSRKIASDEERQRLKRIVQTHSAGMPGGFIVRTAGEGKSEADLAADMTFLYNLWLDIRQKAEKRRAPCLLHHDLELVKRTLRDQVSDSFKAIWVDNEEVYEDVVNFLERFQPALLNRVKLYTRSAPIFDAFNITAELEKALRPKVWLKSGGYIVINQTEALVAVDVNTGKYVGKSNRLEDTIVKTNTEAVKEIARQIRLRDLGGIIVVDFIDMDERRNRQKVMQALEEAMRADRAPYKILQFNDFGLVAITRRRVKQSLERALCAPCPTCEGAGYVKSVQTVIGEILTEARKLAGALDGKEAMLRVTPEVARVLKSNEFHYLEELEEILGRPVLVTSDPLLHPEKFDLA